ncbi:hypothetical protein [Catenulispora rubra]|uniref:hypothetical protein n=1 Tax=Catenulispora rubra TaxID=280293 RepID=UPI0018927ABE|nr:hypothetical protein [Catenulispora rubra]
MTEDPTGKSRSAAASGNPRHGAAARNSGGSRRTGRGRDNYQTVSLGGRRLRVARTLSERTNDRRGYCRHCSGNGCSACAGRGRATTAPGTARASRPTGGRAERTAKRSKAKRPRRSGLLGLLGFRRRTPLRRRMKSWLGKTFGTTAPARRNPGPGRGGQVVAIGGNPGASWWRCPRCGASEYSLPDADVATGRAARHVAAVHPGMAFRIDPQ